MKLLTTLITLAFALSVAASPTRRGNVSVEVPFNADPKVERFLDTSICAGEEILSETYIGEEKNVRLQHITCPPTPAKRALAPRQTNVCGNTCKDIAVIGHLQALIF